MPPTGGFSGFVGGIAQDKYGYMWFATRAGYSNTMVTGLKYIQVVPQMQLTFR